MKIVKQAIGAWIKAAIVLTIGILCIVAGALYASHNNPESVMKSVSIVAGVVLIVVGSLSLLFSFGYNLVNKKDFLGSAVPGAITLGLGISLVIIQYLFSLIILTISIVPYLIICCGAVLLIYAIVKAVESVKDNKKNFVASLVAIVLVLGMITLGVLCIVKKPDGVTVIPQTVQVIIYGIIVTLSGAAIAASPFLSVNMEVNKDGE